MAVGIAEASSSTPERASRQHAICCDGVGLEVEKGTLAC